MNIIEQYTVPILLLIYKKPETTKQVFERIRQIRPNHLYIVGDGAKNEKEKAEVNLARAVVKDINWDCEVKTLFRDKNMGTASGINSAISWFFEQETDGIILEDDCLPKLEFFSFAKVLLQKYKNDSRIIAISGNNFLHLSTPYSYIFSCFSHTWGWATWQDRWQASQKNSEHIKINLLYQSNVLKSLFGANKRHTKYFDKVLKSHLLDNWDYSFMLHAWLNSQLSILPAKNLVVNLGIDNENATHTQNVYNPYLFLKDKGSLGVLKHPPFIVRHYKNDMLTMSKVLDCKPAIYFIPRKFKKLYLKLLKIVLRK